MKKIIALALGLALVLTMAFAGNSFSGTYLVKDTESKATASDTVQFVEATSGSVAHYDVTEAGVTKSYLQVASLAQADKVVYAADGKTVLLYLAEVVPNFDGTGAKFVNFGKKCGQINSAAYDKTKTYYAVTDNNGDAIDTLYVAAANGTNAIMVGNVLTRVNPTTISLTTDKVAHSAAPVVTDGKITGYKCTVCGAVAVEAPNAMSVPSGAEVIPGTNWYFAAGAAGTAAAAAGVNSPKTFDAGIAMYAGLALMSVAGSAVVIGKKKEF